MGHVLAMIFTIILIAVGLFVAAVVICLIVMPEPKTEAEKAAEKSKADASSYTGENWVTFDKHGKVTPTPSHLKTPQLTSFPDVDSRFSATNRLLSKAKEVATTVEEKYFIEQVTDEYYPRIISSLEKVSSEVISSNQKEEVKEECLKQLELIQKELTGMVVASTQRIIDDVKLQTDLISSKVTNPRGKKMPLYTERFSHDHD